MNRILFLLLALAALSQNSSAQGTITMVSTYECAVPAAALLPEEDELDSLVTRYAPFEKGTDTAMMLTLRYERATGRLLEKQVALTPAYLRQVGYTGEPRPYFFQYRYDNQERPVYYRDFLSGRYQVIDYTGAGAVVKTFEASTRRLLDQEVKRPQDVAVK